MVCYVACTCEGSIVAGRSASSMSTPIKFGGFHPSVVASVAKLSGKTHDEAAEACAQAERVLAAHMAGSRQPRQDHPATMALVNTATLLDALSKPAVGLAETHSGSGWSLKSDGLLVVSLTEKEQHGLVACDGTSEAAAAFDAYNSAAALEFGGFVVVTWDWRCRPTSTSASRTGDNKTSPTWDLEIAACMRMLALGASAASPAVTRHRFGFDATLLALPGAQVHAQLSPEWSFAGEGMKADALLAVLHPVVSVASLAATASSGQKLRRITLIARVLTVSALIPLGDSPFFVVELGDAIDSTVAVHCLFSGADLSRFQTRLYVGHVYAISRLSSTMINRGRGSEHAVLMASKPRKAPLRSHPGTEVYALANDAARAVESFRSASDPAQCDRNSRALSIAGSRNDGGGAGAGSMRAHCPPLRGVVEVATSGVSPCVTYTGVITRVCAGMWVEFDGDKSTRLWVTHLPGRRVPVGCVVGATVRVHAAHPLLMAGSLWGLGACLRSRIEVLSFSPPNFVRQNEDGAAGGAMDWLDAGHCSESLLRTLRKYSIMDSLWMLHAASSLHAQFSIARSSAEQDDWDRYPPTTRSVGVALDQRARNLLLHELAASQGVRPLDDRDVYSELLSHDESCHVARSTCAAPLPRVLSVGVIKAALRGKMSRAKKALQGDERLQRVTLESRDLSDKFGACILVGSIRVCRITGTVVLCDATGCVPVRSTEDSAPSEFASQLPRTAVDMDVWALKRFTAVAETIVFGSTARKEGGSCSGAAGCGGSPVECGAMRMAVVWDPSAATKVGSPFGRAPTSRIGLRIGIVPKCSRLVDSCAAHHVPLPAGATVSTIESMTVRIQAVWGPRVKAFPRCATGVTARKTAVLYSSCRIDAVLESGRGSGGGRVRLVVSGFPDCAHSDEASDCPLACGMPPQLQCLRVGAVATVGPVLQTGVEPNGTVWAFATRATEIVPCATVSRVPAQTEGSCGVFGIRDLREPKAVDARIVVTVVGVVVAIGVKDNRNGNARDASSLGDSFRHARACVGVGAPGHQLWLRLRDLRGPDAVNCYLSLDSQVVVAGFQAGSCVAVQGVRRLVSAKAGEMYLKGTNMSALWPASASAFVGSAPVPWNADQNELYRLLPLQYVGALPPVSEHEDLRLLRYEMDVEWIRSVRMWWMCSACKKALVAVVEEQNDSTGATGKSGSGGAGATAASTERSMMCPTGCSLSNPEWKCEVQSVGGDGTGQVVLFAEGEVARKMLCLSADQVSQWKRIVWHVGVVEWRRGASHSADEVRKQRASSSIRSAWHATLALHHHVGLDSSACLRRVSIGAKSFVMSRDRAEQKLRSKLAGQARADSGFAAEAEAVLVPSTAAIRVDGHEIDTRVRLARNLKVVWIRECARGHAFAASEFKCWM